METLDGFTSMSASEINGESVPLTGQESERRASD
jgi:hypothetical protein